MKFTWILFIIQGLFANLLTQIFDIELLPFCVILITTLTLFIELSTLKLPKKVYFLFFFSLFFRLFLLFFDLYGREILVLPNSGLDTEMYHGSAINGIVSNNFGRGGFYSYSIGLIYRLFGVERIISQFVNILLSIHTLLLTYRIMILYKIDLKIRNIVILIMAFLPNFALMSSILLRESIIIFFITLSVYYFSIWLIDSQSFSLIMAFLTALIASAYHTGSTAIILAYAIIIILYDKKERKFNINWKSILKIIVLTIIFGFIYFYSGSIFLGKLQGIDSIGDIFNSVEARSAGGSSYSAIGLVTGNGIIDFIINTPLRMFFYILAPFPWQWRGPADIVAFLFSGMFYGYVLYVALKELKEKNIYRKQLIVFLLLASLFSVIFFSWGVSNAGTALRHRDKFISVFILLLAVVKDNRAKRKIKHISCHN